MNLEAQEELRMMKLLESRTHMKALLTAGLLASVGSLSETVAGTQTVKLTTVAPKGSSYHQILQKMGDEWQGLSNGEIRLVIYPGGIQGGEPAMVERMQINQTHAGLLTAVGLAEIEPSVTGLQSLPMMFRDLEEVDYIGAKLQPRMERSLKEKGYVVLFWADTGWVRYFSRFPVRRPDDLRKLKLLAWGGDSDGVDMIKEVGFNPVRLEASDMVIGLQTGLIDAFACPPFFALAGQLYTYAPHMVDVNWAPLVGACVITKKTWEKITASRRPALLASARRAGETMKATARLESDRSVQAMEEKWNLTVHHVSDGEKASWRGIAEQLYPKIRGRVVPADIFDEVKRLLEEYRRSKHVVLE